jgi:hypothetical protein
VTASAPITANRAMSLMLVRCFMAWFPFDGSDPASVDARAEWAGSRSVFVSGVAITAAA